MLSGLYSIIQQGCGGSRGSHEATPAPDAPIEPHRYEHLRTYRTSTEETSRSQPRGSFLKRCAVAAPLTMLAALFVLPFVWLLIPVIRPAIHPPQPPATSGVQSTQQASPFFREKVLVTSKPTVPPNASTTQPAPSPMLAGAAPEGTSELEREVAALAAPRPAVQPTQDLSTQDPPDGGDKSCGDNEELYGGLCYKKCSLLTAGADPIRTSPWTCCQSHPCALNQKGSLGSHVACTGYDVAGDGSCPHPPGTCLGDEELLLGICYRKCSLLTDQEFPHRVGPATCCKESGLSCLDFRNDYTSKEFAVGGGADATEKACGQGGELLLGICYRKCSFLTGNKYPLRVAAATCCKAGKRLPHKGSDGIWHLGCLDLRQDKTRSEFNAPLHDADKAQAHSPFKAASAN